MPAQPIERNTRSSRRGDHTKTLDPAMPRLSPSLDADCGSPDIKESPTQQELKATAHTFDGGQSIPQLGAGDFVPRIEYQGLERRVEVLEAAIRQAAASGQAQSQNKRRRPSTSVTDSSALEIGWMDRPAIVEEDEMAVLEANHVVDTDANMHNNGIYGNSSQDLSSVSKPQRTLTSLSACSDTSSVRHVPPMVLRNNTRSQVPSQLQQQQQQLQQRQQAVTRHKGEGTVQDAVAETIADTIFDSGYGGSSKTKATQHQDGSTAPPATAPNPGTPDAAPFSPIDRAASSVPPECHVAEPPQAGYDYSMSLNDGVEAPCMFEPGSGPPADCDDFLY